MTPSTEAFARVIKVAIGSISKATPRTELKRLKAATEYLPLPQPGSTIKSIFPLCSTHLIIGSIIAVGVNIWPRKRRSFLLLILQNASPSGSSPFRISSRIESVSTQIPSKEASSITRRSFSSKRSKPEEPIKITHEYISEFKSPILHISVPFQSIEHLSIPSGHYSHSMVAGGLLVISYATRLMPGTSATMRPEMRASTS